MCEPSLNAWAGQHSWTLEQVGRAFGVTREHIRQIETKALAKLRHPANVSLHDFLEEL